ncbi:hypothetical protein [uncultured Chitinophaga sp.]|jgi:hypothetical protein|uniref:hypothetical protein n=1 Tax=uncultured Chitinophaga sp. TaxID=339340 RepID=UPI00260706E7|nr:hypothetical protein [uncultured Chitinophaga sp.]
MRVYLKHVHSLLFVCTMASLLFSCKGVTEEEYLRNTFYQKEEQLKQLNQLIDSLVIPQLNPDEYSSYIVVDCKTAPSIRNNSVCNPLIAGKMRELAISSINLEKGTCASANNYSLYIYKVNAKYGNYSKFYFYHDICDKWKEAKTGKDFVYVPFEDHWSVYVGRN